MEYSIRFSSIKEMLDLCRKQIMGDIKKEDIDAILRHKDYEFEFKRYKDRVSDSEFIDYFLKIGNLSESEIANIDLKAHHKYYQDLLKNLDFYHEKLNELEKLLTPALFEEQISIALKGLPDDIILPKFNFIFTIGIGRSFGYVYENCTHFDFLQLVNDMSISEFCSTIAHEVHHVGINSIYETLDLNNLSLEELFYINFSGEGLAVKYCNNAQGVISKSIYAGKKNIGLDNFTWDYLNNDFYNTMDKFKDSINKIRDNKIKSPEELTKHMLEYWMNPYTDEQAKTEIPKLKHFRLYSFGNDIWGIIHDCFGKKAVFETLKNPKNFPNMFNKALEKIGRIDLYI